MQKYTPPPPPPNWDDDDEASTSSSESSFVESHGVEPMPVPPPVLPEEDEPLPPPFEVAFPPPLPVEEAEEEPLPPAPPAEEAEEEPLPPVPPVEEVEEEPLPPAPPAEEAEKEPLPPAPPVEEAEEEPLPPAPPVEEAEEEPLPPAPPAEEAEEEPLPPAPPVEEAEEEPLPPAPPVEEEPLTPAPPAEEAEEEPLPPAPPVEEAEEEPLPPAPPVEEAEEEPLTPAPPVEEAEEEPLPPAPPAEEAEEEPLPPAPPVEEDVDTFIPPPPPPPSPQKKGNGPIIAMSVVAVFALMLGFQWQGNINRVNADVQKQQSELTEQQEQTKIHTDVLNKAEQLKKEIEEKTAKNEAICAEGRKAEEERDALRQILRSGRSVSHEMERLQADCEKMENLINNLDSRIAYYLPPEQLSAEKLRERDEYLRRLACTYLRARTIGCTILIKKMCANRLRHHLNAMQMTYADRVAGAMDSEFKGYSGKRMFSPISLAYSGVRVEVLSEVTSPGKPKQWCKECWTFNEEGEIIRWEEHLTSGAQPALSEKFRHINLIGQNKK